MMLKPFGIVTCLILGGQTWLLFVAVVYEYRQHALLRKLRIHCCQGYRHG